MVGGSGSSRYSVNTDGGADGSCGGNRGSRRSTGARSIAKAHKLRQGNSRGRCARLVHDCSASAGARLCSGFLVTLSFSFCPHSITNPQVFGLTYSQYREGQLWNDFDKRCLCVTVRATAAGIFHVRSLLPTKLQHVICCIEPWCEGQKN